MPMQRRHHRRRGRFLEWILARRASNLLLAVLLLIPLGTIGWMIIEDMSVLDATYQTVITLSTVGYEDYITTDAGRVFGIIYMIVGVGVFVIALSSLAAFLVEGRLREAIGRRRMEREIAELENHIILCGFGRLGRLTAAVLQKRDVEFVALEIDETVAQTAEGQRVLVMRADATEEATLVAAGVEKARGIISTLSTDAANVYVTLVAKEIRSDVNVVAVAREPGAESKLRAAGADHVISPYAIGAVDLARRMLQPHVSDFLERARGVKVPLEEIPVRTGSDLVGVTLRDAGLRQKFGITIVAVVKTREDEVHYQPDADLVIDAGDVLVAMGPPEGLKALAEECVGR
jgi:voltage-gated potassium channel